LSRVLRIYQNLCETMLLHCRYCFLLSLSFCRNLHHNKRIPKIYADFNIFLFWLSVFVFFIFIVRIVWELTAVGKPSFKWIYLMCRTCLYYVCQALIDLKMFEKADDNFKRAIELEPDSGNIYVHRGYVWRLETVVTFISTCDISCCGSVKFYNL